MAQKCELARRVEPLTAPAPAAFVELRKVARSYPTGAVALADVDLRMDRGESIAITGRSGSGKSTLLNVLGLLDVPTTGQMYIDGHQVEADSDRQRSERRAADLGFVFQRSHLIPALTAKQNVILGLRYSNCPEDRVAQAAEEALAAVGLAAKTEAMARTLSGGEMQRVAIARTLARPAELWLADEPTGNLDSAQSAEIIELLKLRAAERGACLVVVTHEPEIAARMDRVVTLHDGHVVADTGPGHGASHTAPSLIQDDEQRPLSRWSRYKRTATFVTQGVTAHPRRAWSGILAAAIAVTLTLTALGLAQSASAQVTSLFDAQRATQVTAQLAFDTTTPPRWPINFASVQSFSGVVGAEYWRIREGVPMTNGSVVADIATAIEVDSAPGAATDSTIAWSANDDRLLNDGEVLLGSVLAERLGIAQPNLNPEITINGTRVRVAGIVTSSRSGIAGGAAFVTPVTATDLPPRTSADVYIETAPGAARTVADRLQNLVDPYRTTTMRVDPVLAADSYRSELEGSISASLQVLAAVAALAGLVGVLFVNILNVGARTAEFGVRRAFGAPRGELVLLVSGESSLLGILGAALGLAAGFTAVMVVTALAQWQPVFDLRLLLVPLVGAIVFGPLGGLPPAIAAGRIQPADAVRS